MPGKVKGRTTKISKIEKFKDVADSQCYDTVQRFHKFGFKTFA